MKKVNLGAVKTYLCDRRKGGRVEGRERKEGEEGGRRKREKRERGKKRRER